MFSSVVPSGDRHTAQEMFTLAVYPGVILQHSTLAQKFKGKPSSLFLPPRPEVKVPKEMTLSQDGYHKKIHGSAI